MKRFLKSKDKISDSNKARKRYIKRLNENWRKNQSPEDPRKYLNDLSELKPIDKKILKRFEQSLPKMTFREENLFIAGHKSPRKTKMKLWLLFPIDLNSSPWQSHYSVISFVIRADNEKEARKIAQENGGDEIGDFRDIEGAREIHAWTDPNLSECIRITESGPAGIINKNY